MKQNSTEIISLKKRIYNLQEIQSPLQTCRQKKTPSRLMFYQTPSPLPQKTDKQIFPSMVKKIRIILIFDTRSVSRETKYILLKNAPFLYTIFSNISNSKTLHIKAFFYIAKSMYYYIYKINKISTQKDYHHRINRQ